jgi:hypothetical protein
MNMPKTLTAPPIKAPNAAPSSLEEIIAMVDREHRVAFRAFLETADLDPDFEKALDKRVDYQEALKKAVDFEIETFRKFSRSLESSAKMSGVRPIHAQSKV